MATIKDALVAHLLADATINAAVSSRIYRALGPPGTSLPRIILYRIACERFGFAAGSAGKARSVMQVDCIAITEGAAESVAELIRKKLEHYRGNVGSGSYIVRVDGCFLGDSADDYYALVAGSKDVVYRVRQEWSIWHDEVLS